MRIIVEYVIVRCIVLVRCIMEFPRTFPDCNKGFEYTRKVSNFESTPNVLPLVQINSRRIFSSCSVSNASGVWIKQTLFILRRFSSLFSTSWIAALDFPNSVQLTLLCVSVLPFRNFYKVLRVEFDIVLSVKEQMKTRIKRASICFCLRFNFLPSRFVPCNGRERCFYTR